jgi:hypothetical protein
MTNSDCSRRAGAPVSVGSNFTYNGEIATIVAMFPTGAFAVRDVGLVHDAVDHRSDDLVAEDGSPAGDEQVSR